ncbi:MAG: endonuclease VIII [Clostridiales bacterium]|nr:endonuclease VIII [Clostridiales bacterium]
MLELPEAIALAGQLNETIRGKRIESVIAAASPHKFTWYHGEPESYDALLSGRVVEMAHAYGGRVELQMEGAILSLNDGTILRYYALGEAVPDKHQLLMRFTDGAALVVTVAMYGGIMAADAGGLDENFYYRVSKQAVPPLSDAFDYAHFQTLFAEKGERMSAKAFLATEQRIPGLGNGVLQDILLNAKIHPKRKMHTLSEAERRELFDVMKATLREMTDLGGRETERDLFGNPGGYKTKLSKNNKLLICPNCGGAARKEAYMGGSVYYCEECQKL